MEFIYRDASRLDQEALAQGDIIERTESVADCLRQAHQYYADAPDYTHFVVLTQSCDLVRRSGEFRAPYITIAAARPFEAVAPGIFGKLTKALKGGEFRYRTDGLDRKARDLLERYLHNTELEYFFLPESGHPRVHRDLLVHLRLSVALRKSHYATLAGAKIAELSDVFQAKLGWLKGNIYSRVATPDLEEYAANPSEIKSRFYGKYIRGQAARLSNVQAAFLQEKMNAKQASLNRPLRTDEIMRLADEVPENTKIIAANIIEKLKRIDLVAAPDAKATERYVNAVASESSFRAYVNSSSNVNE